MIGIFYLRYIRKSCIYLNKIDIVIISLSSINFCIMYNIFLNILFILLISHIMLFFILSVSNECR